MPSLRWVCKPRIPLGRRGLRDKCINICAVRIAFPNDCVGLHHCIHIHFLAGSHQHYQNFVYSIRSKSNYIGWPVLPLGRRGLRDKCINICAVRIAFPNDCVGLHHCIHIHFLAGSHQHYQNFVYSIRSKSNYIDWPAEHAHCGIEFIGAGAFL